MKNRVFVTSKQALLITIFCCLSGCTGFLLGEENLSKPVELPNNPKQLTLQKSWQHRVGQGSDEKSLKLRPFIVGDRVFASSIDGKLQAFALDSGELLWQKSVGHRLAAGVSGDQNIVVVASENGLLMSFDGKDGKPLWTHQLSTEILSPATVVGGLVVARSIDGQVSALDERNGELVWQQNVGISELSIRGNADALFVEGLLLFTNAKGRVKLISAADGQSVLNSPVTRGRGVTNVERMSDLLATPVIREGVLILSAYRHETVAINLKTGEMLWTNPRSSALDLFADDRYVYLIDKNSIISALEIKTGQQVWQSSVAEGRRISPLSGDGRIIVCVDNEGKLLALNAANGELLSYTKVGDKRTYVAPQWVNGQWLTYSSTGQLTLTHVE